MSAAALSLRAQDGAVLVKVAARPGAGRDAVLGVQGDALRLAVAAPPDKGKANEALRELLAKTLGVKRGAVALVSGETARAKVFRVEGLTVESAREAVERALA